jgi:hypothetical protein
MSLMTASAVPPAIWLRGQARRGEGDLRGSGSGGADRVSSTIDISLGEVAADLLGGANLVIHAMERTESCSVSPTT